MKSVIFELSDSVYEKWLQYKQKQGLEDSGALFYLLDELRYSEEDILNFIQRAAITVIETSGVPSEEELEKLPFLTHHLCSCFNCDEIKCLAHTDCKGYICVSKKNFGFMLNRELSMPIGLFEVLHSYVHEVVHNLYPDAPEDDKISKWLTCSKLVQEKTKEIWLKGMAKIVEDFEPAKNNKTKC